MNGRQTKNLEDRIKEACVLAEKAEFYGEFRLVFQHGKLVRFDFYKQNKTESIEDIDKILKTIPLA